MKNLLKLYKIESTNPNEQEMSDFICSELNKMKDVSYTETEDGIVGFKQTGTDSPSGLSILLSAHMDQVHTNGAPVHFYMKDDCIRGYLETYEQTSLGADDKNGVWLILKLLEESEYGFKFIFSRGEEVGGLGIKKLDIPKADICIVLDRRGKKEILNKGSVGKYCETLAQCLCNFLGNGYETGSGSFSDTDTICKTMESVNMATCYYSPHSSSEYTNYKELCELKEDLSRVISSFRHYPTDPSVYVKKGYSYGYYDGERDLFGSREGRYGYQAL